jgi:hypothetical protein
LYITGTLARRAAATILKKLKKGSLRAANKATTLWSQEKTRRAAAFAGNMMTEGRNDHDDEWPHREGDPAIA